MHWNSLAHCSMTQTLIPVLKTHEESRITPLSTAPAFHLICLGIYLQTLNVEKALPSATIHCHIARMFQVNAEGGVAGLVCRGAIEWCDPDTFMLVESKSLQRAFPHQFLLVHTLNQPYGSRHILRKARRLGKRTSSSGYV